jgi:hypothetical protein
LLGQRSWVRHEWAKTAATYGIALVVASAWAVPFRATMNPPVSNNHYSLTELEKPIEIVRASMESSVGERPRIMARMLFLAHFSGADAVSMPYTDFEGLVTYSSINGVDFLYLKKRSERFPFHSKFALGEAGPYFTLVYEGLDAQGELVGLYVFNPPGDD